MPTSNASPTASPHRVFVSAEDAVCHPTLSTMTAFWTFGLINNLLYVIALSAALDLVGIAAPKGVVLLADIFPSFIVKLIAPYVIDRVSYGIRIVLFTALSTGGMILVSLTPDSLDRTSISFKLLGIVCASLSSGGGELSFLGLTSFYGQSSLAAFSSGTGAAGILGASLYALATVSFRLSPRGTILASAAAPSLMLWAYFAVLPDVPRLSPEARSYHRISQDVGVTNSDITNVTQRRLPPNFNGARPGLHETPKTTTHQSLKAKVLSTKSLIVPFMVPLLLVYIAEYSINQGVAPTLLTPLEQSPFKSYRDFYPTYMAIYQVGVFISRSSTPWIRIRKLYPPSLLQFINFAILTAQALFSFLPSVWLLFAILTWEGLLGGAVYVNTYAKIHDTVDEKEREFGLSATTLSDSLGILLASLISIALEKGLCNWQVRHGQDYCLHT